jgi:hypothetical protein
MGVLQLGQFFISFITGEMPFRQAALDHGSLGGRNWLENEKLAGDSPCAAPRSASAKVIPIDEQADDSIRSRQ